MFAFMLTTSLLYTVPEVQQSFLAFPDFNGWLKRITVESAEVHKNKSSQENDELGNVSCRELCDRNAFFLSTDCVLGDRRRKVLRARI